MTYRRTKTIKYLKENIRENYCDLGLHNDFLDRTAKAWFIQEKMIICTSFKLKIFAFQKTPLEKLKREATDWEKMFANHMSDKVLVFRILLSLTTQ